MNDCDENAICQNVALSFACSCREGFTDKGHPGGPGRNCVKNDDGTIEISLTVDKLKAQVERQQDEFASKDKITKIDNEMTFRQALSILSRLSNLI